MSLISIVLNTLKISDFESIFIENEFLLFFFPLSMFILLQLFSKNGIFIHNENLYNAKYIFGNLWYRRKVNLIEITDITILSFKGSQKFAFIYVALPDKGYEVYRNEIYLLNKKHTIKRHLITLDDKEMAEKAIRQINEIFNFDYKPYNPRFNTNRRRR